MEGRSTFNSITLGKAKAEFLRDVQDAWPTTRFIDVVGNKVGPAHTSAAFLRTATYGGMADLRCGHVVVVNGNNGYVVGHTGSAKFRRAVHPGALAGLCTELPSPRLRSSVRHEPARTMERHTLHLMKQRLRCRPDQSVPAGPRQSHRIPAHRRRTVSQHIYPAIVCNHAVWVQVGWDRPMQQHYLVIEYVDPSSSDADSATYGFVYSNLDDQRLAGEPQLAGDLGYFAQVLVAHGLQPFESVMNEVRKDRAHNVGNRVVKYDAHGTALPATRETPAA